MMYIVTITPLIRGNYVEELSYFSPTHYPVGSVVTVPVRKNARHDALVTHIREVSDVKTEVRGADYVLKKLPSQEPRFVTHPEYIQSITAYTKERKGNLGAYLKTILPTTSLQTTYNPDNTTSQTYKQSFIQNTFNERITFYQQCARNLFARNMSLYILCPTRHHAERVYKRIKKGIDDHTYLFHSNLSPKKQQTVWSEASAHSHPIVFIGTPQSVALPRNDIGTLVIEEEGSPHWTGLIQPFIDFRKLIHIYATYLKVPFIVGDILIRTETYKAYKDGKFEKEESSINAYPPMSTHVIDMHKYKKAKGYLFFAPDSEEALKRQQKTIVYVVRNGAYPLTQCNDCGSIVTCPTCSYPLVLYTQKQENIYACHMCAEKYSSLITCSVCNGWRLALLGIGIERVYEEISKLAPDTHIIKIDDTVKTERYMRSKIKEFEDLEHGILITTERGLTRTTTQVDTTIAVSLDPLFSIPDLRISERIARIIFTLQEKTRDAVYIQHRNGDTNMLDIIARGEVNDFLRYEMKERKRFDLPPFRHLIKLSWTGDYDKEASDLLKRLKRYNPEHYLSFYKTKKGKNIHHILLRVKNERWPDELLLEELYKLPPFIEIQIDPESVI